MRVLARHNHSTHHPLAGGDHLVPQDRPGSRAYGQPNSRWLPKAAFQYSRGVRAR